MKWAAAGGQQRQAQRWGWEAWLLQPSVKLVAELLWEGMSCSWLVKGAGLLLLLPERMLLPPPPPWRVLPLLRDWQAHSLQHEDCQQLLQQWLVAPQMRAQGLPMAVGLQYQAARA